MATLPGLKATPHSESSLCRPGHDVKLPYTYTLTPEVMMEPNTTIVALELTPTELRVLRDTIKERITVDLGVSKLVNLTKDERDHYELLAGIRSDILERIPVV